MALWAEMTQRLQYLPTQTLNELYPASFPMDVRHYLANWIEEQRWEGFDLESMEQETQARRLLEQLVSLLQELAQHNPNVVEKVKLQQISRHMSMFQAQPLQLVKTVRDILRKERILLGQAVGPLPSPQFSCPPATNGTKQQVREESNRDVDNLVIKVLEIQNCRQNIHQLQEELNWERQDTESVQGANEMEGKLSERQKRIQQLEYNFQVYAKRRVQLLQDAVCSLEQCQSRLIHRIKTWRWEQHQATIGMPFDDNLNPLQTWCEQLVGVNGKLRQEIMLVGRDYGEAEELQELQDRLRLLLQTLIQSSLMVEKQPPQVIKTQSKFSSTVRYLLGEKVAPGKPVLLKAQIITEAQARNLGQPGAIPTENVGDLINSTAILEHNTASKSTCATFRNMSIRKIKRADRKGSESVTEEKFALLFSTEITITGCESSYSIQIISLPVVVIVHGSQENNAMATIIWDCAFSEPNRIPFVVPERVPWKQMCVTLSSKFMAEVQTQRGLDGYNLHFLAQKIFDQPDISEDFSNMPVSWAQFNKEVLPGRNFTFWQWFDGVMELTKKYLKTYWSDGLIFGFIGKQQLHVILQNRPNGTFLLRFSDSEIGGITIAYVGPTENGGRRIQNIQPFTKKDLEFRCLGDRIRDIDCITHVFPDRPKDEAFGKYYTVCTGPSTQSNGYLPFTVTTKVTQERGSPTTSLTPRSDTPQDPKCMPAPMYSTSMEPDRNVNFFPQQPFPPAYPADPMVPQLPMPFYPTSLFPDSEMNPNQPAPAPGTESMELEDILSTFTE
ncbi:signal transducer and activator of transcription 6 [Chanos chanos]|uniref:Signal transducer and activator of transcription n=1 Tax=Chanos chanos TaxID=29144 RepID=A0A6J2URX7_CHACN|nr:signal transducer and activator of transcription 5B-like [Chanos chanos]